MQKLTREQIREGLEQVPVEALLMGANVAKDKALTPKQKEFARQLALGESKAGAYRKAYNSKGKPATQSRKGQELAKRDAIQAQAEAFEQAFELERIRTPAMLRALVISKLTEKVLDPEVKDAQQIKALELLGKVTEVAAFTERRETLKLTASVDLRGKLIESLKAAAKKDDKDVTTIDAESLLAELSALPAPDTFENQPDETPPDGHPPESKTGTGQTTHTNPHNESTS